MFEVNISLINDRIQAKYTSQTSYADFLGESQPKLSRFLSGKAKTLDLNLLYKICTTLKLTLNEVIIDDGANMKIQTQEDLINELEVELEKMYKKVKTLKESNKQHLPIVKNNNVDYMLYDDDKFIIFDVKTAKSIKKNNSGLKNNFYTRNYIINEDPYKNEYLDYLYKLDKDIVIDEKDKKSTKNQD